MSGRSPRLAANPIPYWLRDGVADKSPEVLEQAFRDFREIGFRAVKADIPEGMTPHDYERWISEHQLAPSLSLFSSAFDETVDMDVELERAKRFADDQAALGLDRTMVSSVALPARMAEPAVGAGFDEDRLARAVDAVGAVCEVLQAGGLRPLHHSHVGGVFETEGEVVRLLDTLGPDVIGFGPDTGHLHWAGVDPVAMVRRYADRLGGIHLKDVFPDFLDRDAARGMTYQEITATKRLWAEPGHGVVDLAGVMAAVPDDYDGDFMIEVDVPSVETPFLSHQMSFAWAQQALPVADPAS
ncbi:sugar phosphate isomerase/epimerase [uncultured Pseudokineococcus sp.]|uniref:sugar phosphate isomerase/epimerase family protein n=1 Tax=uncultured Pseudokineococcus sp. TaxID=1642928 RepID=UPI00260E6BE1|nr:sugar phosphate isomerase/epimerase [uncultured Pseudokineococcus sp.]